MLSLVQAFIAKMVKTLVLGSGSNAQNRSSNGTRALHIPFFGGLSEENERISSKNDKIALLKQPLFKHARGTIEIP